MLTIYGRKSSFNLQKVMWLVGELGIAHKHIELGGSFGGLDTARPRLSNVEHWYERLQSRSAYREHVCVPFGELYGRLEF